VEIKSKTAAQKRADQIESFEAELEILEQEHVTSLADEQRTAITQYHGMLMERLAASFDIDSSKREKQLSLGMKIASFLGALGLSASAFFLFYQFWGKLSLQVQIFILISAPIFFLAAAMIASFREKTGYFSKVLGLLSLACFILNISIFGRIFNITPSENAFLMWGLLAFLLAYATDARLLLAAGIICISSYLSAKTGTWSGIYWIYFGQRPENFFPAAFILFMVSFLPHEKFSGFAATYRVLALILFFIPVLILSNWGIASYMNFTRTEIEIIYQITGFVGSAVVIWLGIRKNLPEVVNTGNVFFTIFLYTKFYDWWWDWMPKYLFFLVIGLSAIFFLLVFKRIRNSYAKKVTEVKV
jgi:uncharacterized membrane protein